MYYAQNTIKMLCEYINMSQHFTCIYKSIIITGLELFR